MKIVTCIFFAALLMVAGTALVRAHGAVCTVDEDAVMVEAVYHDDAPMSFCDVTVRQAGTDVVVGSGSTDRQGRFFLLPYAEYDVSVEIDDGMGHRATVTVMARGQAGSGEDQERPGDLWLLVSGLGAIMGVAGIFMMIRSRKG